MRSIAVAVVGILVFGSLGVQAADAVKKTIKISNTRIVQASKETTLDYGGARIVVPQGQTVLLGQRSDGMLIMRGNNLSNVQVNGATLSSDGYSVLSFQPESQVFFLNRGDELTLQDPSGNQATIYQGQAVSTTDAHITSVTAPTLQAQAAEQAALAAAETAEVPAFVAESETTNAASEQATQDVQETETVLSQATIE